MMTDLELLARLRQRVHESESKCSDSHARTPYRRLLSDLAVSEKHRDKDLTQRNHRHSFRNHLRVTEGTAAALDLLVSPGECVGITVSIERHTCPDEATKAPSKNAARSLRLITNTAKAEESDVALALLRLE